MQLLPQDPHDGLLDAEVLQVQGRLLLLQGVPGQRLGQGTQGVVQDCLRSNIQGNTLSMHGVDGTTSDSVPPCTHRQTYSQIAPCNVT